MKKIVLAFFALTLILAACGPSPQVIQKAIEETQTAIPTITPIPLTDIDLSKIAFSEGDLPPGYSPSQIRTELGDVSRHVPEPINWFSQAIAKENDFGGIIDVVVYNNQATAKTAYDIIIKNMINDNPADPKVGEQSRVTSQLVFVGGTVDLAFLRCNTVAHVQLMGTTNENDVIAYMTRLDNRLSGLVCP